MNLTQGLYGSTLGKKTLMAVTGIILFGFVVGHMLGNLQLYMGPGAAQPLRRAAADEHGAAVGGAAGAAVQRRGAHPGRGAAVAAQPPQPAGEVPRLQPPGGGLRRRTMVWSGPIIALFVIYHLPT
jgi:succinate dehydrogenase / fumarate reductase, cytochrome b subunit